LGINERAEKVLHFQCGWTNRGEDNVFDKKSQRIFRKLERKTTLVEEGDGDRSETGRWGFGKWK